MYNEYLIANVSGSNSGRRNYFLKVTAFLAYSPLQVVMQSGCTKPSGVCMADLALAPVDYTLSPRGYDEVAIGRVDYVTFNINVSVGGWV